MPQITLLPSFGDFLTSDEKNTDQSILVSTTGIENTQFVSVALTTSPEISYSQQMANNSATITVPTSDLQQLTDGRAYQITASTFNVFGDYVETSFNFSVATPVVSGIGSVEVRDEGITVGFASVLDFTGTPITATGSTIGIATIKVIGEGGVGGGGTIYVKDENIPLGIVTTFNFTGLGVTANVSGQTAVVSIAGTVDAGEY